MCIVLKMVTLLSKCVFTKVKIFCGQVIFISIKIIHKFSDLNCVIGTFIKSEVLKSAGAITKNQICLCRQIILILKTHVVLITLIIQFYLMNTSIRNCILPIYDR